MEIHSTCYGSDPLKVVWTTMDKSTEQSAHFGIFEETNGKFAVVRGDGYVNDCCENDIQQHAIYPWDFLGEYDEAWEAVESLLAHLDEEYGQYHFQGSHPRDYRALKHPRGKKFMV